MRWHPSTPSTNPLVPLNLGLKQIRNRRSSRLGRWNPPQGLTSTDPLVSGWPPIGTFFFLNIYFRNFTWYIRITSDRNVSYRNVVGLAVSSSTRWTTAGWILDFAAPETKTKARNLTKPSQPVKLAWLEWEVWRERIPKTTKKPLDL